ncbi:hypothetical protein TNCV_3333101 [Trichonephila clavipes]|nr:hypothetical protein TNCV_3333101 [Trichonephila clavipes]
MVLRFRLGGVAGLAMDLYAQVYGLEPGSSRGFSGYKKTDSVHVVCDTRTRTIDVAMPERIQGRDHSVTAATKFFGAIA